MGNQVQRPRIGHSAQHAEPTDYPLTMAATAHKRVDYQLAMATLQPILLCMHFQCCDVLLQLKQASLIQIRFKHVAHICGMLCARFLRKQKQLTPEVPRAAFDPTIAVLFNLCKKQVIRSSAVWSPTQAAFLKKTQAASILLQYADRLHHHSVKFRDAIASMHFSLKSK